MIKLLTLQGEIIKPENWKEMVKAKLEGKPIPVPKYNNELLRNRERENFISWLQKVAEECLRILKPGGHALVWALPRTSHWTVTAWENAGFEVRDRIIYCFGSGFPKNYNIAKGIESLIKQKSANWKDWKNLDGVEYKSKTGYVKLQTEQNYRGDYSNVISRDINIKTKEAKQWEGWGTGLKPAVEDWWLLRKPLEKGLSIAENVLKWGTGGLNIDECRTETKPRLTGTKKDGEEIKSNPTSYQGSNKRRLQVEYDKKIQEKNYGRFPSHLIIDDSEEVKSLFPNSSFGNKKGGYSYQGKEYQVNGFIKNIKPQAPSNYGDSGSASRFFYCAKASRSERNNFGKLYKLKSDVPEEIKKEIEKILDIV